ncbi:MAG: hypothetical protein RLZZ612_821 [Pseudomonadota bacterium]|jgi:hypothetical protein
MFKQVQVPFLKGTVTQTSAMQRDSGAWHGGNDYSAPIGTPILSGTYAGEAANDDEMREVA